MPKTMGSNAVDLYYSPAPGVVIQKVVIKDIEDLSNYPLAKKETITIGERGFAPELCLLINSIDDKKHYLFGKFEFQTDKISGKKIKYLGWRRGGNAVWAFLYNMLGEFTINDDDSIPTSLLQKLVGKSFYKLRYCTGMDNDGKLIYKDYNNYFAKGDKETNMDELYKKFLTDSYAVKNWDKVAYDNYILSKNANVTKFDPKEFEDNIGSNDINEDIM